MHETELTIAELGNDPPLIADGRSGPPDRREVSARWLTGTFLTGLTSTVLMGVALVVALDGREQLATPPEIADIGMVAREYGGGEEAKTTRLVPPRQVARARNRRRMEVSMMTEVGDRKLVRTVPFVQIKMPLAAGYKTSRPYPPFDPLEVFAEDGAAAETASIIAGGQIYGSKVESEMSLKTVDFPMDTAVFDEKSGLTAGEVEEVVRTTAAGLTDGAIQVAALHYVDPQRFGDSLAAQALTASLGVRIVPENVSVFSRVEEASSELAYAEDLIPLTREREIVEALADAGYDGDDAKALAEAVAMRLHATALKPGTVLTAGLEVRGEQARMVRLGVYAKTQHILTVAVDDRNVIVAAPEPEPNPGLQTAFDDTPIVTTRGALPTVYDGIYQAAYSYGMSRSMTRQLIKLLASEVDFQSRLNPTDQVEVFFSQPDENDQVSKDSELLYVAANFGGNLRKYYRFAFEDGSVEYFDGEGRSSQQFLLRKPVPTGQFRSGFGSRHHPLLGYTRMHTGVDWAAPRGTPILAAGNGVVDKSGWSGGYGRQTVIRHANGYETSYSHQSGIASGIKPGARVRQGQVIGFVGNTGLSTGPHLHFELIVNDRKVDPMRVRLPSGSVLKGNDLARFNAERERIDNLLKEEQGGPLKVASAKVADQE